MVKNLYIDFVIKITSNVEQIKTKDLMDIEKAINDIIGMMDLYIH